jgi:hypothetical protein
MWSRETVRLRKWQSTILLEAGGNQPASFGVLIPLPNMDGEGPLSCCAQEAFLQRNNRNGGGNCTPAYTQASAAQTAFCAVQLQIKKSYGEDKGNLFPIAGLTT